MPVCGLPARHQGELVRNPGSSVFWLAAGIAGALCLPCAALWAAGAPGAGTPPATTNADTPPATTPPAVNHDTTRPRSGLFNNDEAFQLPTDWRKDDGSFNQVALVAQQKKRLDSINKTLGLQMKSAETPHFLVFSNAGDLMIQSFVKGGEALYANLCRVFGIPPADRVWDGKCILLLFATDYQFRQHVSKVDGFTFDGESAYFMWERRLGTDGKIAPEPQLMHICIPTERAKPALLQRRFSHEGTHAFFALYYKPVPLPTWLSEGLAEYMTVVNDPSLRADKMYISKEISSTNRSLGMFFSDRPIDMPAELYCVAFSMVECLITQGGGPKIKKLIMSIKDGKTADQALQAVYGVDTLGLERAWTKYLIAQNIPNPPGIH